MCGVSFRWGFVVQSYYRMEKQLISSCLIYKNIRHYKCSDTHNKGEIDMSTVRNAKGSVRAFILEALKNGQDERVIFADICLQKGLKPGNAKLHIKKAKAQFAMQVVTASAKTRKTAQQAVA